MDNTLLESLSPTTEVFSLDNGLTVVLAVNRQAPVVTTALWYRAGARDETPEHRGTAHFLEHMMFKGSSRYGPGEIDRRTQCLGGSNNALTSHDATLYYFSFAPDRWHEALEIEADRMAGLTLDPNEVASERQVILEELAMYEGEPWDALELAVTDAFYRRHPYGRPVLGTRETLAAIDGEVLHAFHRQRYRPDSAVLVVAGEIGEDARHRVEDIFGAASGHAEERPDVPEDSGPGELIRLDRRHGEVPRILMTLPAPAADHPDHPHLRLLLSILAGGRSSRLHHRLVDDGQRCVWVSAEPAENLDRGLALVALEVVPGIDPDGVADEVLEELDRLRREAPSDEEIRRAGKVVFADWIFAHEKVHEQAVMLGFDQAFLHPGHTRRYFEHLLASGPEDLLAVARRYLSYQRGAVLGRSLPEA